MTVYYVYNRMTGAIIASYSSYVDAFNCARRNGPGYGVRDAQAQSCGQ